MAEAGIVKVQVTIILPPIPQRTAERRRVVPTPMIAPAIVCVVLTGISNAVAPNRVNAPAATRRYFYFHFFSYA